VQLVIDNVLPARSAAEQIGGDDERGCGPIKPLITM